MGTAVKAKIVYRILPAEEWDRLKPIFEGNGAAMPRPQVATAAVAERDGEIIGMLILQNALHVEPLWIKPPERGVVSWRRLLEDIENLLPNGVTFYSFAASESVGRLCEISGMTPLALIPFMKEKK